MGMREEKKGLMSEFSKEDIYEAYLRRREMSHRDRKAVLRLEKEYREVAEALGLLPENNSHSEVIKRANACYDALKGTADRRDPDLDAT